jgi:ribosomal protein L11 methyltransferase
LIKLAPQLAKAVRPGGLVVLSGILGEQVREVIAIYAMSGFRLQHKEIDHNWATLVLRFGAQLRQRSVSFAE